MKKLSLIKSLGWLFLAQSCVGVNIVLSKGLIEHIPALLLLCVRFSFASCFMLFLLLISRDASRFKLKLDRRSWLVLLSKALGAGVVFNFIMLSGLFFTSANSAGLITSALPAVVIGLNVIIFKQQLTRKMLISLLIAVCGLLFINYAALAGTVGGKYALWGNLLILLSLIPDGLYYTLSKYYPLNIHPLLKVLLLNALNLPFLFLMAGFYPLNTWSKISSHDWLLLAIIGLTSGGFFVFWQYGVRKLDAAYAALSTAFMPVATVILAYLILAERLSYSKLFGMSLIIVSIISYARK